MASQDASRVWRGPHRRVARGFVVPGGAGFAEALLGDVRPAIGAGFLLDVLAEEIVFLKGGMEVWKSLPPTKPNLNGLTPSFWPCLSP